MQNFTHGEKTVEFTSLVGEVIGSEKRSETYLSSSGGGGYVGREGLGYLVYRYTVDFKCYKKMETRLNTHLEQLAQQAYDNDRARQMV
ncbi:hypothetical protein [Pseudomonas sp. W5-36]|uniref:hypothetical protein n=1 Tax=Pseudomonas sp. W5-36 TaxID=3097455 RepID=UPI00397E6C1E